MFVKPSCSALLLIIFLNIIISCSDNDLPDQDFSFPVSGTWKGMTSELTYIELEIKKFHSAQKITNLRFSHRHDTLLRFQEITDENGLAIITSNQFVVELPDRGVVAASFPESNLLKGTLRVLDENSRYKQLHFTATHSDSALTVYSAGIASFTARGITYTYNQEINNLFPFPVLRISDRGVITETGIRIEKGYMKHHLVFAFRAGTFRELQHLKQYFFPGYKPFATMDEGGIEVIFFDPELYLEQWSSAWGCRDQKGSFFRIIAMDSLPTSRQDIMRLKIHVEYSCKVYGVRGDTLQLNNGMFIGVIDIPR